MSRKLYSGGDSRLQSSWFYMEARIITGENISVVPDFVYMTQGKGVTELNIGGAVEYSLPDNENPATLLSLGGYYRNKDALIVTGCWLQKHEVRLCYDFNTGFKCSKC